MQVINYNDLEKVSKKAVIELFDKNWTGYAYDILTDERISEEDRADMVSKLNAFSKKHEVCKRLVIKLVLPFLNDENAKSFAKELASGERESDSWRVALIRFEKYRFECNAKVNQELKELGFASASSQEKQKAAEIILNIFVENFYMDSLSGLVNDIQYLLRIKPTSQYYGISSQYSEELASQEIVQMDIKILEAFKNIVCNTELEPFVSELKKELSQYKCFIVVPIGSKMPIAISLIGQTETTIAFKDDNQNVMRMFWYQFPLKYKIIEKL